MHDYYLYAAMLNATTDMKQLEHIAFHANLHLPHTDDLLPTRTKQGNMCEDLPILFEPTNGYKRHLPESPVFEREENLKDLTSHDMHPRNSTKSSKSDSQ